MKEFMKRTCVFLNNKSTLQQGDFSSTDCTYILCAHYTLVENIVLPPRCILSFCAGSIDFSEGKILTLNNTLLTGDIRCFVQMNGTAKNDILKSSWVTEEGSVFPIKIFEVFCLCREFIIDSSILLVENDMSFPCYTRISAAGGIQTREGQNVTFNGFKAGIYSCLHGDGLFRFCNTEYILPQWFGKCGYKDIDSTSALQKAFYATRHAIGDQNSDASYGCSKIYLPRGIYKCSNVDVFANVQVEGELAMATNGSIIVQNSPTYPALRIHCKNYSETNYADNRGNGIGSFTKVVFRSKENASQETAAPILKFVSPQESTQQFNFPFDTPEGSGFTDFNFEFCWFQFSYNACIEVLSTFLDVQLINCTFDVVTRAIHFGYNSSGYIRCVNTQFFYCLWGALLIESSQKIEVSIRNSLFRGCGGPSNPYNKQRYSIIIDTSTQKESFFSIEDCVFEPIKLTNAPETFGGALKLQISTIAIKNCIFSKLDNCVEFYKVLLLYTENLLLTGNIFQLERFTRGQLEHSRIIGLFPKVHSPNYIISNNSFIALAKDSNVEYLIHSDMVLFHCVVTHNYSSLNCQFCNNNITKSGNYLYGNAPESPSITGTSDIPSLAPSFHQGDIVLNRKPETFIGWYCQSTQTNIPHWCRFGNAVYTESISYGITDRRPQLPQQDMIGHCYFDETLHQPIWWDGYAWRDAKGNLIATER